MWKWFKDYFAFTAWERNAALLLSFLCIAVAVTPFVYRHFFSPQNTTDSTLLAEVKKFNEEYEARQLAMAQADSAEDDAYVYNPFEGEKIRASAASVTATPEYFRFDPNKIGVAEWVRLGFSEKQAEVIERIKQHGFVFYKPEDLARVRVIGESRAAALAPFVAIEAKLPAPKVYEKQEVTAPHRKAFTFDINEADSSMWERQRGIGPRLAQRIINYRNRLGGFTSVTQIKEVWNMPDSTYQFLLDKMVINPIVPARINVNTADVKTMGKHPYINFPVARVIDAYRKEHGPFRQVDDLRQLPIISDSLFSLMAPYISVE